MIPTVEALVEGFYASVAIDEDLSETLRTFIGSELKASLESARRLERSLTVQRQRLMNERSKLLQAHYAGAIPLDLLKTEQDRIAEQLKAIDERVNATEASYEELAGLLDQCLHLARDCHRGYLNAPPSVRRMFNHAFFDKLYIDEDGVRAEFAEPFATLLGVNTIALAKNAEPRSDVELPDQSNPPSQTGGRGWTPSRSKPPPRRPRWPTSRRCSPPYRFWPTGWTRRPRPNYAPCSNSSTSK